MDPNQNGSRIKNHPTASSVPNENSERSSNRDLCICNGCAAQFYREHRQVCAKGLACRRLNHLCTTMQCAALMLRNRRNGDPPMLEAFDILVRNDHTLKADIIRHSCGEDDDSVRNCGSCTSDVDAALEREYMIPPPVVFLKGKKKKTDEVPWCSLFAGRSLALGYDESSAEIARLFLVRGVGVAVGFVLAYCLVFGLQRTAEIVPILLGLLTTSLVLWWVCFGRRTKYLSLPVNSESMQFGCKPGQAIAEGEDETELDFGDGDDVSAILDDERISL